MANNFKFEKFLNFLAYVAIIFVAVALLLGKVINSLTALRDIAEIMAYFITAISAFYYARSKRNPWIIVAYIVAVVIIIVILVLRLA